MTPDDGVSTAVHQYQNSAIRRSRRRPFLINMVLDVRRSPSGYRSTLTS